MPEIDRLDGLSLSFSNWRLNLRSSSTEPLLRLNIETRGDRALLATKLAEVEALIAE
jgi:phosphomannomutase